MKTSGLMNHPSISAPSDVNSMHKYSVQVVYSSLDYSCSTIYWAKNIWNRLILSEHRFRLWLTIQGKLLTDDKLSRMGGVVDHTSILCSTE
ncbi:hypothetical protein RDABS01_038925 [Bienertia sinuspersici]